MAVSNTYTDLLPRLWYMAVQTVRENSVMPKLVLNLSDQIAGTPGQSVQIPDQVTVATRAVVHDINPVDPANQTLSTTALTLDNHREAPFTIDDKMAAEVVEGTVPRLLKGASVALAAYVDAQIMAVYPGIYNCGAPDPIADGTTPVDPAFLIDATNNPTGFRAVGEAGTLIDQFGAPQDSRRVVLSPRDNWDASFLGPFLKANERGDREGILRRNIGTKLDMDWWMDQAIPTHTSGTLARTATQTLTAGTGNVGDTTHSFTGTITTALTVAVGDIFKFNNHNQTYVNNTLVTSTTNALAITSFSPPLKVAVTSANSAEILPSHKVNLLFHPDAIAFASRPFQNIGSNPYIVQAFDEVSGLNLRLEYQRQNKQDYISLDVLFGVKLRDAKLISRVASAV